MAKMNDTYSCISILSNNWILDNHLIIGSIVGIIGLIILVITICKLKKKKSEKNELKIVSNEESQLNENVIETEEECNDDILKEELEKSNLNLSADKDSILSKNQLEEQSLDIKSEEQVTQVYEDNLEDIDATDEYSIDDSNESFDIKDDSSIEKEKVKYVDDIELVDVEEVIDNEQQLEDEFIDSIEEFETNFNPFSKEKENDVFVEDIEFIDNEEIIDDSQQIENNLENEFSDVSEEDEDYEVIEGDNSIPFPVRYYRSFLAKLIQSNEEIKEIYYVIRNKLLVLEDVKSQILWNEEIFRIKDSNIFKLKLLGENLYGFMALDPNLYVDDKFNIERSNILSNIDTPLQIKIDSKSLKCLLQLIDDLKIKYNLNIINKEIDFIDLDYKTNKQLLEEKLIKEYIEKDKYNKYFYHSFLLSFDETERKFINSHEVNFILEYDSAIIKIFSMISKLEDTISSISNENMSEIDTNRLDEYQEKLEKYHKDLINIYNEVCDKEKDINLLEKINSIVNIQKQIDTYNDEISQIHQKINKFSDTTESLVDSIENEHHILNEEIDNLVPKYEQLLKELSILEESLNSLNYEIGSTINDSMTKIDEIINIYDHQINKINVLDDDYNLIDHLINDYELKIDESIEKITEMLKLVDDIQNSYNIIEAFDENQIEEKLDDNEEIVSNKEKILDDSILTYDYSVEELEYFEKIVDYKIADIQCLNAQIDEIDGAYKNIDIKIRELNFTKPNLYDDDLDTYKKIYSKDEFSINEENFEFNN